MFAPTNVRGLVRRSSISAGLAFLVLAAAAAPAPAQFRGVGQSAGPHPATINSPRVQRVVPRVPQSTHIRELGGRRWQDGEVAIGRRYDGPARVHDDRRQGDRRHGMRVIGPAIGIGVGVAIGTMRSAVAAHPPVSRRVVRTSPPGGRGSLPPGGRGGISLPPGGENRMVGDEVVLEFPGNISPQSIAQLLRRHGLSQVETQQFALSNSTFVRARITAQRSLRAALRRLAREAHVRSGQANYVYRIAQQPAAAAAPADSAAGPAATIPGAAATINPPAIPVMATSGALPIAGDPAQYVLEKLRLNEAHRLATGDKILVAVIDSAVDLEHPELRGVVVDSFDALGKPGKPHAHGTAIAGAIASHVRLRGTAPAARILAIRAFGEVGTSAEATTFAILKGIEYAVARNARVINMSFTGPSDPALSRQLAAARSKGVVLVAASGNFGPKSPPQYPAADPNVIAVSATDADDRLFKASNVGRHVAVAAPGVDILLPAPGNNYQLTSGTSFSAAHVAGVAALILQRAPALAPEQVRQLLEQTAKDLGPRGKDTEYGAGLVDAYQAIVAAQPGSQMQPGTSRIPAAQEAAKAGQ